MIHNFERLTAEVQTYKQQHEVVVEELRTLQMQMSDRQEEMCELKEMVADLRGHVNLNSHGLDMCCSNSSRGATKHCEFSASPQSIEKANKTEYTPFSL